MTSKQAYNREYYLRNKDILNSKAKLRYKKSKQFPNNIIPLFDHIKIIPRTINSLPKIFYLVLGLCFTITLYLIKETAEFYQPKGIESYVKAILLEMSVITFTLLTPKRTLRMPYTALVWCIYTYSLWTLAGGPISQFYANKSNYYNFTEDINNYVNERNTKLTIRNHYISYNYLSKANALSKDINELSNRINSLKIKNSTLTIPSIHFNSVLNSVFFRFLLMISNFYALKELKKLKI